LSRAGRRESGRAALHPQILGAGTITVDDFLYVARYPAPDHKAPILRKSRKLGGLIGTALAAAARLGATCGYAGVLGTDELSDHVKRGLDDAGVDRSRVLEEPEAGVTHSIIVVAEEGHTRNIFYHLQMSPLPRERVDRELVSGARVLIVDQLGKEVARVGREAGLPVVADMDWSDRPDLEETMLLTSHLILSSQFARDATGCQDPGSCVAALHGSSDRPCTAVTWGAEGCYYCSGPGRPPVRHQPGFFVSALETTGCGDVFHGAYAAALAGGRSVEDSLRYASAAAALYASRPSGWEHLPRVEEVEELLGE
jgi:sugar/nucleoside kinase (ribokinase family)